MSAKNRLLHSAKLQKEESFWEKVTGRYISEHLPSISFFEAVRVINVLLYIKKIDKEYSVKEYFLICSRWINQMYNKFTG